VGAYRPNRQELSERSIQHQVSQLHDGWLETKHVSDSRSQPLLFTERGEVIGAGKSGRQRFLDQYVDASLRAEGSDLHVRSGRSCDHRGIERLERHRTDIGEPTQTSVSAGDLLGTLFARVYQGDGHSLDLRQGANMPLADRSGANYENPE
jgi:hypothetical protein